MVDDAKLGQLVKMAGRMALRGYDDKCPTCNGPGVARCRCGLGEVTCAKGHTWFKCPVHKCLVIGKPVHDVDDNVCQCSVGYAELVKILGDVVLDGYIG